MSRLNKANEIIELAILMQNSYCGLTLDDIKNEFECSRRTLLQGYRLVRVHLNSTSMQIK